MTWENYRDLSWNRYYEAAVRYRDEHGHLNVPARYKTKDGIMLGAWIRNLRTYKRNGIQSRYLTDERIAALDGLGMVWSVSDHLWEENYADAEDFYCKNGHLNIPANYISPKGLKIGAWIRVQRDIRLGKYAGPPLTEEKIERLNAIGMVWQGKMELAWEKGLSAAKSYYKEHGDLNVPTSYIDLSGYKLGAWLADRREKGKNKLSPERQRALDELGMIWKKPDSWEVRYALAREFYEQHGHLNIPAQYKAEGIWLSKWLNEQQHIYRGNRKNKQLSAEQIERLETIGMTWEKKNV